MCPPHRPRSVPALLAVLWLCACAPVTVRAGEPARPTVERAETRAKEQPAAPFEIADPAGLVLLGAGLLAAAARARRPTR